MVHSLNFSHSPATYPWWPAVIFEPDDPEVPQAVLKTKNDVIRTDDGPLHLVRFFDRGKTWYVSLILIRIPPMTESLSL